MPRLTGRQLVAIVVAICCAVVLQPVASTAAGTLMTLVDKTDNTRQSRVTSNGGLTTESRPGAIAGQFHSTSTLTTTNNSFVMYGVGPTSFAFTNITFGNLADGWVRVAVQAYVRTSGSQNCTNLATATSAPTGWSSKTFGVFLVPANDTLVLPLTQPWTISPGSGATLCFGYRVMPSSGAGAATAWTLHGSFMGYRYAL